MSEYWVSHKKYLCKYCNIYIADDAPSRRQHETGLKHKGNVERFVRGLYKAGEKRKQDLDEEKREIARIEKAANAAYAQDVSAGRSDSASSSRAGSSAPSGAGAGEKKTAGGPKPSSPFANYSTAESLGFTDPDAERAREEAERRRTQGVAGEWEIVEVAAPTPVADGVGKQEQQQGEGEGEGEGGGAKVEGGAEGAREGEGTRVGEKRAAEVPLDDEDSRGWKLRRKVAHVGLGDLYDPGALPIKLKAKKMEESAQTGGASDGDGANGAGAGAGLSLGGSEKPRWSARGWNKPGEASSSTANDGNGEARAEDAVKTEDDPLGKLVDEPIPDGSPASEVKAEVKTEDVKAEPVEPAAPPAKAGGSMFKKRKAPVGGGNRGGRRI
ncbi:hypothetical protein GSI_01553 [Ganoderma sinense ZZ0214-1]|uniref:Matrin-type domain-containing protein n=1 Tax=Ganoderma sinense ZZ0214-1 TaxID=1077348 RepID=A0A2G8SQA2_9APHY|nr:hypothetical protein GSI_01553 [Ganoderma sinense ZZ0214-1]